MKHPIRSLPPDSILPAMLAGLTLLITGCATIHENTCAQFEENRKDRDYSTQYQISEADSESASRNYKKLPRGKTVIVRLYKMRVDPPSIKPCHHLMIHKDIYLQRDVRTRPNLEEVRDFYTDSGKLIASKTESISDQLRTSGYYTGETPLPIPEKAPPGKYRIVSRLIMRASGKSRAIVLARTTTSFEVVSRE